MNERKKEKRKKERKRFIIDQITVSLLWVGSRKTSLSMTKPTSRH